MSLTKLYRNVFTFHLVLVFKSKTLHLKHMKRQATQHDCLPSLLVDEDKGIEMV
jgi:hypothetical protein